MTATTQVAVAAAVGIAVAVPVSLASTWALAPSIGWDAGCIAYIAGVWHAIWPLDHRRTAERVGVVDPTRATADLVVIGAAIASLVAVGFILRRAGNSHGSTQALLAALGLATVVLSWAVVHTVYTLRYARLYYSHISPGGIDFNDQSPPSFSDFAYLAFTIGMTFQVSDTSLKTTAFRRLALSHGLLSYLFGVGIVAASINLIANLH